MTPICSRNQQSLLGALFASLFKRLANRGLTWYPSICPAHHATDPLSFMTPPSRKKHSIVKIYNYATEISMNDKEEWSLATMCIFPLRNIPYTKTFDILAFCGCILPKRTFQGSFWPFKGLPSNNPENRQIDSFLQNRHQIILKNADNPAQVSALKARQSWIRYIFRQFVVVSVWQIGMSEKV